MVYDLDVGTTCVLTMSFFVEVKIQRCTRRMYAGQKGWQSPPVEPTDRGRVWRL